MSFLKLNRSCFCLHLLHYTNIYLLVLQFLGWESDNSGIQLSGDLESSRALPKADWGRHLWLGNMSLSRKVMTLAALANLAILVCWVTNVHSNYFSTCSLNWLLQIALSLQWYNWPHFFCIEPLNFFCIEWAGKNLPEHRSFSPRNVKLLYWILNSKGEESDSGRLFCQSVSQTAWKWSIKPSDLYSLVIRSLRNTTVTTELIFGTLEKCSSQTF